ncbi:hypothetical protein NDU88_000926 [Pleurodeles waltl]|uniref:Uncharacterized protein n=1 Tax=Pleurodeles waltl TaxID=8319 RepID=A0AAV7U6G1_PLEWA|nr:hypothetical protein NDU88_000926 [Pleurodeles waltl]
MSSGSKNQRERQWQKSAWQPGDYNWLKCGELGMPKKGGKRENQSVVICEENGDGTEEELTEETGRTEGGDKAIECQSVQVVGSVVSKGGKEVTLGKEPDADTKDTSDVWQR